MAIRKHAKVLRYVAGSKAVAEKADTSRRRPMAFNRALSISARKLKAPNRQSAIDSCLGALETDPSNTKNYSTECQDEKG